MATTKAKPEGADAPAAKRTTFIVTQPLLHGDMVDGEKDEKLYEPDEEIELTDSQAKPLIGLAIKAKKAAAKPAA